MLRWLISILLLLNLGLFAWGFLQPRPLEQTPPSLSNAGPILRLLSEKDQPLPEQTGSQAGSLGGADTIPPAAGAKISELSSQEQKQNSTHCLLLGPFERQVMAAEAAEGLAAAGHDAHLQVKIERRQSGYWVMIRPGNEDPDFVIVNLELAGIQDMWRFNKGELAGAISLGLYSDRKQARLRQDELRDKGFDAEIGPRQMEEPGYWIETTYTPGDEAAEAALEQLYIEHQWLGYPPQECEEVATP